MKNIKDTLLKIFLVILLLLIVSLIGLVVYKVVVKDEPQTSNETSQTNTDNDENTQNSNNQNSSGQNETNESYGINIAQTNFNGVIKAAELGYAKALQANPNLTDGTCTMNGTSPITCTNGVTIELSGVSPTEGIITFKSGVALVNPGSDLKLGDYYCNGNSSSFNCSPLKSSQG